MSGAAEELWHREYIYIYIYIYWLRKAKESVATQSEAKEGFRQGSLFIRIHKLKTKNTQLKTYISKHNINISTYIIYINIVILYNTTNLCKPRRWGSPQEGKVSRNQPRDLRTHRLMSSNPHCFVQRTGRQSHPRVTRESYSHRLDYARGQLNIL